MLIIGWLVESRCDADADPGDDAAPGAADEPELSVLSAGLAASSFPLPADMTDGKLRCAAGASDRTRLVAVAGMMNTKARASVVSTTGRSNSFFTG